jgi:opacity protein-like surface antigen
MKWLLILVALFASTASAADANGTWKAVSETPNGSIETTFVLKAADGKLTGTMASSFGPGNPLPISDATLDGDKISFTVVSEFNGNEFRLNYKGTVGDTEIKLTLSIANMDQTFELVAKKQ